MGIRVSTASSVIPEGLGIVLHDQNGINGHGHSHGHGLQKVGSLYSQQGLKGINQDAAIICQGYGTENGVLCGVFDGHGKDGHVVSKFVRQRLPLLLLDQKNSVAALDMEADESFYESQATNYGGNKKFHEWEEACVNAFKEMDREIKLMRKVDYSFSGTTAVVVMKQDEDLIIANLGDSRAMLGTKTENGVTAIQLTTDLKPNSPDEADRIRKSNGRVFALKEEPGVQRAWLPRVYCPGIAMSRAFGDFVMKNHGIISTPVVTHHLLTSDDLFIVLATDGVWDVLSNDEVASIVWSAQNGEMAAKAVVNAALDAWKTKFPMDKRDDCTVVCLFLHEKPAVA